MEEELQVEGKVEEGVILLTIRYGEALLMRTEAPERLSAQTIRCYREMRERDKEKVNPSSCVIDIQSETAGSPVVRMRFELWREVGRYKGGQVICVNYPQDYIDGLTSLGLPGLPGFSLAGTTAEAIQKLTGK